MNEHLEFGSGNHEHRAARYKLAFESTFPIFNSDQATSYAPDGGAEEFSLRVPSQSGDTLGRLGVGSIEASYIGSTLHDNGYQDPETMSVVIHAPTGEVTGAYTLMHHIASDEYTLEIEKDETSPLVEEGDISPEREADDRDVLEYLAVLNASKENLTYSDDTL